MAWRSSRPATGMPAFKVGDKNLSEIAQVVASLSAGKVVPIQS